METFVLVSGSVLGALVYIFYYTGKLFYKLCLI